MRFVAFNRDDGYGFGLVSDGQIHDLTGRSNVVSLDEAVATGALQSLARDADAAPLVALDSVTLLPPVRSARIFCIGVNYAAHRDEMKNRDSDHPTVFVRFASSVVGSGAPIVRPFESDRFDWEGELAVIIGRGGRRIAKDDALTHVAGYSCFMDGSLRDFQRHTSQFTPGKNFDRSGAFGPWLVTPDEVGDPSALSLATRVNGAVMQQTTTDLMIFDVPSIIAYLSTFTELQPGDVIATGTPGGVGAGRTPPSFLAIGDRVEVEISGVGLLSNVVVEG